MKDHELRELINDVTAVARIYAHTQQLRQQISQLIVPIFEKLKCEHAFLSGFKEGAESRIKELQAECEEQARLNGMGSEREARQLSQIENLRKELATAQAAANNSSVENIVLKKRLFQAEGGHKVITPLITPITSSDNNP